MNNSDLALTLFIISSVLLALAVGIFGLSSIVTLGLLGARAYRRKNNIDAVRPKLNKAIHVLKIVVVSSLISCLVLAVVWYLVVIITGCGFMPDTH